MDNPLFLGGVLAILATGRPPDNGLFAPGRKPKAILE